MTDHFFFAADVFCDCGQLFTDVTIDGHTFLRCTNPKCYRCQEGQRFSLPSTGLNRVDAVGQDDNLPITT